MSAPSRTRAITRELFWLMLLCAVLEVLALGLAGAVSSVQTWLLLLGLAFFGAHALRIWLQRLLGPLAELTLQVQRWRDINEAPQPVDITRLKPFSELALAVNALALRMHSDVKAPETQRELTEATGERRTVFLRSVSHELRTPLNAILGFTEVLLAELDGPLDREQRENLTIIRDSGKQLLWTVNDVIDLAALATTHKGRPAEDIDLTVLLDEVRDLIEERRGMRLVHVRVQIGADAEHVYAERASVQRALRVLSEYALEQTQSGEVLLSSTREGEHVILCARGDSAALDEAGLTALLSPEAASDRKHRVMALRLAITQELAVHLGGRVEVRREEGQSAALALRLPIGSKP